MLSCCKYYLKILVFQLAKSYGNFFHCFIVSTLIVVYYVLLYKVIFSLNCILYYFSSFTPAVVCLYIAYPLPLFLFVTLLLRMCVIRKVSKIVKEEQGRKFFGGEQSFDLQQFLVWESLETSFFVGKVEVVDRSKVHNKALGLIHFDDHFD